MRYDLQFWVRALVWGVVIRELWVAGRLFKRVNTGLGGAVLAVAYANMFYQAMRTPLVEALIVPGIAALIASLALFEWAARTIRGLFFSYIFSNDEPQFVCSSGPFHYIRNPFYSSYLLSQLAVSLLFPNPVTIGIALGLLAYFWWAAYFEEQKFAKSAKAGEYEEYKRQAGRFLPHFAKRA